MSVVELTPTGGTNDQDAINWVLAAARNGQRIALVGKFVISFRPIQSNTNYFGGILIPSRRWLDISEAEILLAPNQPTIVDPKTKLPSTQFAALITNAEHGPGGGRDIRISGGAGSFVDGNALNQKANDCRFNGVQFRNTVGYKVEGVVCKNVRGIDGMGGPTESFVFDVVGGGNGVFRDSVATADPAHKAETSTGFSANVSDRNLWDHCEAFGLKDHGFTSWKATNGTRAFCRGHHNDSTGGRWEYGADNRDIGCSYDSNVGDGLVLQGTLRHQLTDPTIVGNRKGLVVVEGSTYALSGAGTVQSP